MALRVGIDTGGTFTDLVVLDEAGRATQFKVPSTPDDPARALVEGVSLIDGPIAAIAHGTTVATNAMLEEKFHELALITTPEPRLLVVQPFDASTVADIERALKESNIGIQPAVDGKIIRLPIPELSEERRKDLVRSLGKMAEEARVRVRANRRAALDEAKKLKASGGLTEDGLHDLESQVQKLTDRSVKSVDDHLARKETEIMKV